MNEARATAWSLDDNPESRKRLAAELTARGWALVKTDWLGVDPQLARRHPWEAVERVFGVAPLLVEQQPIASTSRATPLHTDSQVWRGVPPHAQLMFCGRAAREGGASLLVDGWKLVEALERRDPALVTLLFEQTRSIPFVFGDVVGSTVSLRGGCLTITCSPRRDHDELARRLAPALDAAPRERIAVHEGELLIVDNHRMLHGREAFADPERHFTRLLAWLPDALGSHPRFRARASGVANKRAHAAKPDELWRLGLLPAADAQTCERMTAVLEMLRGAPPGVIARRLVISEALLYRWRDAALRSIERALDDDK
jgi:hypothetical protein